MLADAVSNLNSNMPDEDMEVPAKRMRIEGDQPSSDDGESSAPHQKELSQEHIFNNLRLRRIVRENHSSTVNQLSLFFYRSGCTDRMEEHDDGDKDNTISTTTLDSNHGTGGMSTYERTFNKRGGVERGAGDNSNLLGTVGSTQVNIYDNEHCGDHLDIMSHYQLGDGATTEFLTCCWLNSPSDALFVFGGEDKLIHIMSLAWSREIRILHGHTASVVDVQPHPTDRRYIASVGRDKTIRIWSILSGMCLCIYNCEATVCRFHPNGKHILTGSSNGEIRQWDIPFLSERLPEALSFSTSDSLVRFGNKKGIGAAIDCIRFANGNVLSKCISGRIDYWRFDTGEILRSFNVRHNGANASRFDVSFDDRYLCVGNSRGSVYIYDIEGGQTICHLVHKRSVRPVSCCAFTRDCRSVIYTGEGGFIWRYDYVDDETLAEWGKLHDASPNDSSNE